MFDSQRGGRRPTYRYDKTDLILLGGGGLFVIVGAALAIGAWLDPAARRAGPLATVGAATPGANADATTPPRTGLIAQHDSAAAAAKTVTPAITSSHADSITARPVAAAPAAAPTPSTTAKPTTTAAPDVAGQFLLQLGSFGQQENADRLAARARTLGFTVSVVPAGALHRVLIGGFTTRAAAIAVRDSLARTLDITPKLLP